jgi:hypothetical protein
MVLGYELWETQSGNLMASYERESEALRAVADRARRHGPESITSIALVQIDEADEDGEMVTLATGADLLARAATRESPGRNGQPADHPRTPAEQSALTRATKRT